MSYLPLTNPDQYGLEVMELRRKLAYGGKDAKTGKLGWEALAEAILSQNAAALKAGSVSTEEVLGIVDATYTILEAMNRLFAREVTWPAVEAGKKGDVLGRLELPLRQRVLAHVQSIVAAFMRMPQLPADQVVRLMDLPTMGKDAKACAFVRSIDSQVHWLEFVSQVQSQQPRFYDPHRPEPLDHQVRAYFYTAGQQVSNVCRLLDRLLQEQRGQLPNLINGRRSDVSPVYGIYAEAQDRLTKLRETWVTGNGQLVSKELTQGRLDDLNARIFASQAEHAQGGTALALTVGTDAQPGASPDYTPWQQVPQPKRASPGFTHDALELQQQAVRSLRATQNQKEINAGLLPLYAAVCAGRLHRSSPAGGYSGDAPDPATKPTTEQVTGRSLRIMSGLWLDEALDAAPQPVAPQPAVPQPAAPQPAAPKKVEELILQCDPAVFKEAIGSMPFWLLLVAESFYAALVDSVQDKGDPLRWEPLVQALDGLYKLANMPNLPNWADVNWLQAQLGKTIRDRPDLDALSAADQLMEFATVFMPAAERCGLLRDLYTAIGPLLETPGVSRGKKAKGYLQLMKAMYSLGARHRCLKEAHDIDYEARSLQLLRHSLAMRPLNAEMLGSFGERTFAYFDGVGGGAGGSGMRTARQFYEASGTPRGAQSACLKSGHLNLQADEVLERASNSLAEAFGGPQGWLADVLSPSRPYLAEKFRHSEQQHQHQQQKRQQLVTPEECLRLPRAALASLHRQELMSRPFFWLNWYARLALAQQQGQAAPGSGFSERQLVDQMANDGHAWDVLPDRVLDENDGLLEKSFRGKIETGLPTLVHLWHPEDRAGWQRAWHWWMGAPAIASASPALYELMQKAQSVTSTAEFATLLQIASAGILRRLSQLRSLLGLPSNPAAPGIRQTGSLLHSPKSKSVPSDLSGFVESVTGSMNYGSIEQSFQDTYASCVRKYPQVLEPEMSMTAVVLSLLRAELDEVADAVFGIMARAVAGVLAEVPVDKDADVPAKLKQLSDVMGQDPGLSGLLRANLEWVFQLGQHLCSFPGAVTVTLPLYWQEFVLGRVVGSRPGVKLQLLNGLEREFCCQPDAIRALPSRVHESAASSLDTEGSLQEDLPDRLAVSHPTWRQALSLFCDRCSHHSRQFLRDCNVLNVDTRQQIRYHEEVAEERGVGVANMSDRQLLAFAVYILIGNTSQSLSTPMDKTRAETLQNAYNILERPALRSADTLLLLLDAPERLGWADIPQETTDRSARALVRTAAKTPAALDEYQSGLNPKFAKIIQSIVKTDTPISGGQLDNDPLFKALREHSQFQNQLMARAISDPHKSNTGATSLITIVDKARQEHQALAQNVAALPPLDQADARYRTRYPALHDMLFSRDVANSAVHQLQRLLGRLPGLPTQVDQQNLLVLAYRSDAATLAYAYRSLLETMSQRGLAPAQLANHQKIEQRVQELQSESAPAGALAMQLQELTTYLAVADAQHIADQGKWQQFQDITAEFNRRLQLAGTLTSTPEYADYMQNHAKLLHYANADALGNEADRIETLLDENAADPTELENKLATKDPQLREPLKQIDQFISGLDAAVITFAAAHNRLLQELIQLDGQEFAQLEADAKTSLSQAYDQNELPKLEDDVRNSLLNRYQVMGKAVTDDLVILGAQYQSKMLDQAQVMLQTAFAFIRPAELRVEKRSNEFAANPDQLTHNRLQAGVHSALGKAKYFEDQGKAALVADFEHLESNVRPVLDNGLQALRQSIIDLQNMLAGDPSNANLQQTVNDLLAPAGSTQTTLQAIDKVVAQWELQRGGRQFAQAISQGEAEIAELRRHCSEAEALLAFYTLHLEETQQAKELARDAEAFSVLVKQVHTFRVPDSVEDLKQLVARGPAPANDEKAMRDRLAELSVDLHQEISDIGDQENTFSAANIAHSPTLEALKVRLSTALKDIGQLKGNTDRQRAMYDQLHPTESGYLATADNSIKEAENHLQTLAINLEALQLARKFIGVELPKAQEAARDQLDKFVAGSNNRLQQQAEQFDALVKPFVKAQQAANKHDANLQALHQAKSSGHLYPKRRENAAAGLDTLAQALNNPAQADFVGLVDKVGAIIQALEKNRDKGFKLINDFYADVGPTEAVYDAYQALQRASYDQGSVTESSRQAIVQDGTLFPLHQLLLTKRGSTPIDGQLATGLTELDNFVRTATALFTDLVDLSTRVQTLQAELSSSSSGSSGGVTPADRVKGRARAIYQAELALVNQHASLLHQRAESIRRSPAGDELGLAHALAAPETQMTWEQAVDGHKLVAVDARVNQEVGSMASGSAPSQSQQLAQDLAAKADAVLKSSAAGRAASVFTVGQEPGHLKSIQQQLQVLDNVSGPVDYSQERQNFIAALGQLQAEFVQDKADIDRIRAVLEARVVKERAAVVGQVGSAINLFNGVNETLLADGTSAAPVPRVVWAKILGLRDVGTTYGKVWFTKSQLNVDYVRIKTKNVVLDENNAKHAEILNLVGRLAFVAVQLYYYRLLEWATAFDGATNLPVSPELANCITWTGANYKIRWNKMIKTLIEADYLTTIGENPGADASSIVEGVISTINITLPDQEGIVAFLAKAEKFDYPAIINDIVTEANQRGIPLLKVDPYDSVNVAASPWLSADFDLALNPPPYDPKKVAPPPGQLSPGGSGGRKKPVKFYDDEHPLDYAGVDKTDMFNFFTRSPETQGAGPAIFTDAWVGFWASKAPFGPGAKIGNADAAAAIIAISKMNAKTKTEQNARLGFLYVAYLKFVEAQTGLVGFKPVDGSFARTADEWLIGASKAASAYSKDVGTLIREITRACLMDLEPMYLALHNGQVDPQHPFQINTRASAFKDVALDNIRDQLVNMQNGYLYTRTLAEKYQFKDVKFYRTTVAENRTPTRVLNSPNAKASNARATPAPIVAAESSGQDYPQIHMDPRFARAPRI